MKDAKGHGSDAHGSGVEAAVPSKVGITAKTYSWDKDAHGIHRLSSGNNIMTQIGGVVPQTDVQTGKKYYHAEYNYPQSTGNASSGWSRHGSVTSAKKYVEGNLAKFWEPPKVQS